MGFNSYLEPLLSRNTEEYSNPVLYNLVDYLLYIYELQRCQQSGFRLMNVQAGTRKKREIQGLR